jgi:hypothetical protein
VYGVLNCMGVYGYEGAFSFTICVVKLIAGFFFFFFNCGRVHPWWAFPLVTEGEWQRGRGFLLN